MNVFYYSRKNYFFFKFYDKMAKKTSESLLSLDTEKLRKGYKNLRSPL